VSVKLGTFTLFARTRISQLADPMTDPDVAGRGASAVLRRFEPDRPVRLLGVGGELDRPFQQPCPPR